LKRLCWHYGSLPRGQAGVLGHFKRPCVSPGKEVDGVYNLGFLQVDFSLTEAFDVNTRVSTF
jgi:hypothetical protein